MKLLAPLSLFRQALKYYSAHDSLRFFDAATKIGQPGKLSLPNDLIQLGLKMHLRGLLNAVAIQSNRDWIWPYWIERQFNPRDKSFIPRSHALAHINLTHRNWTILGAIGDAHRCIVDPRGLVTPWPEGWSLDFWVANDSEFCCPSRWHEMKQRIDRGVPVIKTNFQSTTFAIKTRVFAANFKGHAIAVLRVRVSNSSSDLNKGSFYFSIRPYNPEGISLVRELEFVEQHLWRVNGCAGVYLPEAPDSVFSQT